MIDFCETSLNLVKADMLDRAMTKASFRPSVAVSKLRPAATASTIALQQNNFDSR